MDSITVNFGPLVVPLQNVAGLPHGATDVNIWSDCLGCGQDSPSPGF